MTINSHLPLMTKRYLVRTTLHGGALLVLALALLPQTSFAPSAACGNATTGDQPVNNDAAWTGLRQCLLDLNDGVHSCVVTACADFANPFGVNDQNRYRFATSVDAVPVVDTAYERTAVLTNEAGIKNPDSTAVCTVEQSTLSAGYHHFYSWGRKWSAATSGGTVADTSLSVVCVDGDSNANPNDLP